MHMKDNNRKRGIDASQGYSRHHSRRLEGGTRMELSLSVMNDEAGQGRGCNTPIQVVSARRNQDIGVSYLPSVNSAPSLAILNSQKMPADPEGKSYVCLCRV